MYGQIKVGGGGRFRSNYPGLSSCSFNDGMNGLRGLGAAPTAYAAERGIVYQGETNTHWLFQHPSYPQMLAYPKSRGGNITYDELMTYSDAYVPAVHGNTTVTGGWGGSTGGGTVGGGSGTTTATGDCPCTVTEVVENKTITVPVKSRKVVCTPTTTKPIAIDCDEIKRLIGGESGGSGGGWGGTGGGALTNPGGQANLTGLADDAGISTSIVNILLWGGAGYLLAKTVFK